MNGRRWRDSVIVVATVVIVIDVVVVVVEVVVEVEAVGRSLRNLMPMFFKYFICYLCSDKIS